ncbi:hypothetical protein J2T02_002679 [Chitinophaga terrae (ex Kim and Jung 2007)]|nr:hypothetical protein [Chitinophaga terrae (ex Kim and Jung 2007)]
MPEKAPAVIFRITFTVIGLVVYVLTAELQIRMITGNIYALRGESGEIAFRMYTHKIKQHDQ